MAENIDEQIKFHFFLYQLVFWVADFIILLLIFVSKNLFFFLSASRTSHSWPVQVPFDPHHLLHSAADLRYHGDNQSQAVWESCDRAEEDSRAAAGDTESSREYNRCSRKT